MSPMDETNAAKLFGDIAVEMGLASRQAVGEALRLQAERKKTGAPRLIGQILVETKAMPPSGITLVLARQGLVTARCRDCGRGFTMKTDLWHEGSLCPMCRKPLSLEAGDRPAAGAAVQPAAEPRPDGGTEDLARGMVLGGCEIDSLLGRGGMGSVYKARHAGLRKDVAVKVLSPGLGSSPGLVERFLLEARAAAKLDHENIVGVLNTGFEQGRHFIVMQYVQGETLAQRLEREGKMPARALLEIAVRVGRGLAAAHKRGIIHRDIKPSNIMISTDGAVKVADFGLAKDLGSDAGLSRPGTVMGSPYYMSPEQAEGLRLDQRTDIYSLGVTLYHCLSGRRPFTAETPLGVLVKHIKDPPVPLRSLSPEVPKEVADVVEKMMSKLPEDRFPDCEAMAAAMESALAGPPPREESGGTPPARARISARAAAAAAAAAVAAGACILAAVSAFGPGAADPPADAPDRAEADDSALREAVRYAAARPADPADALAYAESLRPRCSTAEARRGIAALSARLRSDIEKRAGELFEKAGADSEALRASGNLPGALDALNSFPARYATESVRPALESLRAGISCAIMAEIRAPVSRTPGSPQDIRDASAEISRLRAKYKAAPWGEEVARAEQDLEKEAGLLMGRIAREAGTRFDAGDPDAAIRMLDAAAGMGFESVEANLEAVKSRWLGQSAAVTMRKLLQSGDAAKAAAAGRRALETGMLSGATRDAVERLLAHAARLEEGMVHVDGGAFVHGGKTFVFDSFYIDRFEATNAQYKAFMIAGGYSNPLLWPGPEAEAARKSVASSSPWPRHWDKGAIPRGEELHPVRGISWYEARAYAIWKGRTLPTEVQWMAAAGFEAGTGRLRNYPYGDKYDPRAAYASKGPEFPPTTSVDSYPSGRSPSGLYHAAGNVYEWVDDWLGSAEEFKILKGGDSADAVAEEMTRVDSRGFASADSPHPGAGFRTACGASALRELGLR